MEINQSIRKVVYILISLLVAVATWFFVDSNNATEVSISVEDIRVEFIGAEPEMSDRGLLLLDDSDQYISLELQGIRSLIAKLDPDEVTVVADLSGITTVGEQTVTYRTVYPSSEFTGNITTINASAYSITVNIGELYSKQIPVRCEIVGAVADGYSAGTIELSQETLEIRGLEDVVDQVTYAKVVLEIDEATRSVTQTLSYQFYDDEGNEIDGSELQTEVDEIQVTMPVNVTKQVRLVMDFIEAAGAAIDNVSYTISPEYITISGDAEQVENIHAVVLDTYNLLDLSGNTSYSSVIALPEGVENLSGYTRATMEISFDDMKNTTLLVDNYLFYSIPEGKVATVVSSAVGLRIFGTTADVDSVLAETVVLNVDLSDYSGASGTYTVPVTVELNTDNDVGLLGTYTVQVNIDDEPEPEPEVELDESEQPQTDVEQ